MTLTVVDNDELPSLNSFVSTVTPGIDELQDNTHFLHEFNDPELPKSFVWPLSINANHLAKLTDTYLNVARPRLNPGPGFYESNTYVSLPHHITNLFDKIIAYKVSNNSIDGGMQIGANIGTMMPDPFKYVHLNPGCLTEIVELNNNPRDNNGIATPTSMKNPFAKLTNNFNKLLKISHLNLQDEVSFDTFNDFLPLFQNNANSKIFDKILVHDQANYQSDITSMNTAKLQVSVNVNVVNLFGISGESEFVKTESFQTNKPYTSLLGGSTNALGAQKSTSSMLLNSGTNTPKTYTKTIEVPLLRFTFKNNVVVTCLKVFNFNNCPIIVMGLNCGKIFILNAKTLKCKIVLNSNGPEILHGDIKVSPNLHNNGIISLEIISHPVYQFVILAGTSNGEFFVVNPFGSNNQPHQKLIIDSDELTTYFKKFDLSPFLQTKDLSEIIGHLKLSYKPITCITSTVSLVSTQHLDSSCNPWLVAIGSEDGLVRVISLPSSQNTDYGSNSNRKSIISDVISNYFQSGVRDIKFSDDFKILAIGGNGDLIELFKINYYNVNALLNKKAAPIVSRRSRSDTANSVNSANQASFFLSPSVTSPTMTSPSTSFDMTNNKDDDAHHYPPAIKDIKLACRLKSHTNVVNKIEFIKPEQIFNPSFEDHDDNNLLYRLLSIGEDAKVIFWEFDYRALPKIKAPKKPAKNNSSFLRQSNSKTKISKNLALNLPSFGGGNNLSINNILDNPVSGGSQTNLDAIGDQIRSITNMYISLYDIRLKKHYYGTKELDTIIHPIVNDKLIPSVEIPLAITDFDFWFQDGKISSVYVDSSNFWCFGRNGDTIHYVVD